MLSTIIDFSEDTVDGKGTTHATVLVVFQPACENVGDASVPAILSGLASHRTLKRLPSTLTEMSPCSIDSRCKPSSSEKYKDYSIGQNHRISRLFRNKDLVWSLMRSVRHKVPLLKKGENSVLETSKEAKCESFPT